MMNYELFLDLATQNKLGTLSQDRYEMLQRATSRGTLSQTEVITEWWKSYSKPKTLEDHYDNYKTWCLNHSTKPLDFVSWKLIIQEELN
jgi:hypothetical protein